MQSSPQGSVRGRTSDDQGAAGPPRTSDQWPMTHAAGESAKPEAGQAITGTSACLLRPWPGQPTATRVGQGVCDMVVPAVRAKTLSAASVPPSVPLVGTQCPDESAFFAHLRRG